VTTAWPAAPLGTLCEVLDSRRKPITKSNRIPGPIPYYGASGVLDYVDGFLFDEKLVLLGEDGAKWQSGDRSAFIIDGKSWVNNHAHALRPMPDKLTHEWLTYFLISTDLSEYITGVTVPKLNQERMRTIPIPLPPLDEQKRIVAKLDAAQQEFDRLNNNLEQQLSQLTDFDSALLSEMLGDPCQTPEPAVNTHWSAASLGELVDTLGGLWTGKKDPLVQATVIRSTNFGKDQRINLEDVALLEVEASQFGKRKLQYGDLILEKSGGGPNQPIGRVVVFDLLEAGYSYSNFTNRLRIRDQKRVLPEFLHRFLTHFHLCGGTVPIQSNSTSIRNLSMPDYLKVEVPLPPLDEQKRIVAQLDEAALTSASLRSNILDRKKSASELQSIILTAAFAGAL
jgi:type I restriction enzyme S subunit